MDGYRRAYRHGAVKRLAPLLLAIGAIAFVPGCSLYVMAGKMIFGDPQMTPEFTMATGVRLTGGDLSTVVIARVPSYLSGEIATLESDLITGITSRMQQQGIAATDADTVIDWIDERGTSDDVEGAAAHFDVNYVIHFELEEFANLEEKSTALLRGRANGTVRAYKVEIVDQKRVPRMVFEREFQTRHPRQQPVSVGDVTRTVFARRHLDQLCDDLARKFHPHSPGAGI